MSNPFLDRGAVFTKAGNQLRGPVVTILFPGHHSYWPGADAEAFTKALAEAQRRWAWQQMPGSVVVVTRPNVWIGVSMRRDLKLDCADHIRATAQAWLDRERKAIADALHPPKAARKFCKAYAT